MQSVASIFRNYAVFDENGKHVNGTDKQSNHAYGAAYEQLITDTFVLRNNVHLVMEVGVADGSCLLAWRDIFPNALVVGMDIHHSSKAHGNRLEFHLGDQRSKEDCERATQGRLFDMIVEDATHNLDDSLRTLLFLWPFVRPGGLYVIEEFWGVDGLIPNILELFPFAKIIGSMGPFGGSEPLVALRKEITHA